MSLMRFASQKIAFAIVAFILLIGMVDFALAATLLKPDQDLLPKDATGNVLGIRVGNRVYSGDIIYYLPEVAPLAIVANRWPGGALIYSFSAEITDSERAAFEQACNAWAATTPIVCRERTTEPFYVVVTEHAGTGCGNQHWVSCAPLGYRELVRNMEIYQFHWSSQSLLRHEIGHMIGFIHEHQRSDRDLFVQYNEHNVAPGNRPQFRPIEAEIFLDYDYQSIMHYRNCAFSVHDDPNDPTDCLSTNPAHESIWSLLPRPCGVPDSLGGNVITELDLEAVRRGYAPAIFGSFSAERSPHCGNQAYSKPQVEAACGSNCQAASQVVWNRKETFDGYECYGGPGIPEKPDSFYAVYCTRVGKEYIRHWTDVDTWSCATVPPKNKFEWWSECGCSVQMLTSSCIAYNKAPDRQKVLRMIDSEDPKEQAAGRLFAKMNGWHSRSGMQEMAFEPVARGIFARYSDENYMQKIGEFSAALRIYMAVRQKANPAFELSAETVEMLVKNSGFDAGAR